jgi:hypothetical protein
MKQESAMKWVLQGVVVGLVAAFTIVFIIILIDQSPSMVRQHMAAIKAHGAAAQRAIQSRLGISEGQDGHQTGRPAKQ